MNPETKPEDKNKETMQAADAAPKDDAHENYSQSEEGDATASAEPGDVVSGGPKAYVDPSIAAEANIAELEAQIAEIRDKYVRAVAENDNLRKRAEREKSDVAKYAVTKFASDMLAIADNLRRAIEAASAAPDPEEQSGSLKALLEGVALTDQELQKSLEKNGIRPIAASGEIFDPHKHQAVMEQDDASVPAGTILKVFQDGYQIEDRVLRPSMVVVAKGGAKTPKAGDVPVDNMNTSEADSQTVPPAADAQAETASHGGAESQNNAGSSEDNADGSSSAV